MIAQLSGTVSHKTLTHIILDVHGVGYLVAVRNTADFTENEPATVHTYLAVRENALDLYGFLTLEEREIFELLLRLPKIGPKSAMQILSQADISLLKKAVLSGDPTCLSKMSGIGAKSAEKIVLGLKDIFENEGVMMDEGERTEGDTDVIDALVALGYSERDARTALQNIPSEITDTNSRIKEALKSIAI